MNNKKVKKTPPLKCYYLMVSRFFGKDHPRAGQPTFFVEGIIGAMAWQKDKTRFKTPPRGAKVHTMRLNWELWAKRFEEIAAGKAYLSLRYWMGDPYKTPQEEFARLTAADGIGLQKISFPLGVFIDDYDSDVKIKEIATNDGLSWDDFKAWFNGTLDAQADYAIIHFTSFRYENNKD